MSVLIETDRDLHFMREALKEAKRAYERDEVPVGAVLVHQNKIIARGHNQVELLKDATAHAEMLCLTAGASRMGNWRLAETTLYCTLEPCCMCAGALFSSRVKRLVWGAPDKRLGANGSWIDVFGQKHPMHEIEVVSGVLEEESAELLKTFFQKKRIKNEERNRVDAGVDRAAEKESLCIGAADCSSSAEDDLLQPNDFPELELHPHFRYEEGILDGLRVAYTALLAK